MVFPVSWSKIATSQGYALARILSRDVEESATSFRRACMDVQSLGRGCDSNFTQSWDSNSNFIKMPDSRAHSSMDALAATTQKHPAICYRQSGLSLFQIASWSRAFGCMVPPRISHRQRPHTLCLLETDCSTAACLHLPQITTATLSKCVC
jgi:hypothetical protein